MAGRPTKYIELEKLVSFGFTNEQISFYFDLTKESFENTKSTDSLFQSIIGNRESLIKDRNLKVLLEKRKRSKYRTTESQRKANNQYAKKYLKQDINKRIRSNFSSLLRHHLKGRKVGHTFDILGYTVGDLINHLESLFNPSMSWGNYGSYWHIDHKKPASWFKYETTEDEGFKKCWCLENLQPLEANVNLSKSNRYAST